MPTPHGSDRVRAIGAKILLHSRLSKGWTPRTPKSLTHSEHPGTAVYWGEEYFEVVAAESMQSGGVRYVLEAWREDHIMRAFVSYDDESEARIAADYTLAEKQRRNSVLTRLSGIVLGHLPSPVQNRLGNEMGVSPSRLTIVSCIPPVVLLGVCVYLTADAAIKQVLSPLPPGLMFVAGFLTLESGVRFYVAMSQNRGMGSLLGTLVYMVFYAFSGSRKPNLPAPLEEPGDGMFFMIPPSEQVALQDSLTMRGPMLTLLTVAEQERLARVYGFNYRDHAFGLTWIILIMSVLGAVSSWVPLQNGRTSAIVSLLAAGALGAEQIFRLIALRRGPAGSVLGFMMRPFVKDLLK